MLLFRSFLFLVFLVPLATSTETDDGGLCEICIDLISQLEDWLTEETTMDEIIAYVETFCEALGGMLQGICEGLIEMYLPDLLEQLANGLEPSAVCSSVLGDCDHVTTTPKPITPDPPHDWYWLETGLEGGKVLEQMGGGLRSCNMQGKGPQPRQFWRLKDDGCLTNMAHQDMCLTVEGNVEGVSLAMHQANGQEAQIWTYTSDHALESAVRSNLIHYHLVLDIIWADVALVTDGAGVHAWHNDGTDSQKWRWIRIPGFEGSYNSSSYPD